MPDEPAETELEARAKSEPHITLPEWTFAAREDPDFFRPFADLRTHVFSEGRALPRKYRELVHLCLLAHRLAPDRSMTAHLHRAREAGASTREIMEAFETAMIAGGVPTYLHGMNALLRFEGVLSEAD
jgi:alkylhydroperoxidase/carboxymuconolactone decarboxylase family protein YurZ